MKQKNIIYSVEIKDSKAKIKCQRFKRLKDAFAYFSHEELGCGYNHITNYKVTVEKPFENKKVKISLIKYL